MCRFNISGGDADGRSLSLRSYLSQEVKHRRNHEGEHGQVHKPEPVGHVDGPPLLRLQAQPQPAASHALAARVGLCHGAWGGGGRRSPWVPAAPPAPATAQRPTSVCHRTIGLRAARQPSKRHLCKTGRTSAPCPRVSHSPSKERASVAALARTGTIPHDRRGVSKEGVR